MDPQSGVPDMKATNIAYSIALPPIIWLVYGMPSLGFPGNAVLFAIVLVHLYVVIWQSAVFEALRGSEFTYGMVMRALNGLSLLTTVVTCGLILLRFHGRVTEMSQVPGFAWGLMALSMLGTLTLPLFSSRDISPLPLASQRRAFENPCDSK